MKIELIKNSAGKVSGYEMIAENQDDKLTLGSIRQMYFFGSGDDVLKYNGIKTEDSPEGDLVVNMSFATISLKNELKKAMGIKVDCEHDLRDLKPEEQNGIASRVCTKCHLHV